MNNGTIGEKLKRLRTNADNRPELQKLSRKKFCDAINAGEYGVPVLLERTLRSWENGQNKPNTDYLEAFCSYFSVDMSYWFDDQRIASKKIIDDISNYTGLNYDSVIEITSNSKDMDQASLQARDNLITTGTMELLSRYASRVEACCHELQVHSQIILNREQNSEDLSDKQYSMLFKLDLYRIRDYREKMVRVIDDFLVQYADYTKITENAESIIDLLEIVEELPEEQEN